jgi:hypothetical protein
VAVGAVEHRQRQEDGVWVPFQSLTALVLKTALATPPKSRKALVHNGETWRIDNVGGHQATEAAWVITASRFPTAT